jgi:TRAP-type C4-dicarboxylate transport system substrate-binding protein
MQYTKLLIFTLLVLTLIPVPLAISCTGLKPVVISSKPIEVIFATTDSPNSLYSLADQAWMSKIEEETNYRIHFTPYWGASLINATDGYDQLVKGVCDIARFTVHQSLHDFDIATVQSTFYYGVNYDPLILRRIYEEVSKNIAEVKAEYKDIKLLGNTISPPYQLLTIDKPIYTYADLKGLTIRVGSTSHVVQLKDTGAELVVMHLGDANASIRDNVIDGMLAPIETLQTCDLAKVVKYAILITIPCAPIPSRGANLEFWNSLPADIQQVFENNIEYWESEIDRRAMTTTDQAIDYARESGVEFIELSKDELDKFNANYAWAAREIAEELDTKGLPGTEIFEETRRIIDEYNIIIQ